MMEKMVFVASSTGFETSTSKYGRRRVAAGETLMSQLALLSVVYLVAAVADQAITGRSASRRPMTSSVALTRAFTGQNRGDGAEEDLEVERRRPVVDVLQVELHPAVEVDVVAAADLPEAREPRLHRQPSSVPPVIRRDLLGDRRPRPDQAHVALQDVPELRDLIERELRSE